MPNPFFITYPSILKELDRELVNLMEIKQQAIRNGSENLNGLTFRIEAKKRIIKILRQHRKDPTLDLYALNEQLNHA